MFSNAYQNGPCLEIWDSKVNTDKNVFYKQLFRTLPASLQKNFDKESKSYILLLQGHNSKIILPADDNNKLSLHQRYLVLQLFIPLGCPWSMEFCISDLAGTKRRINLTASQGKQESKYFSLRYPLDSIQKGQWIFLGVDIYSFMSVFKDQTFRSLDHLTVSNTCKLRRIFSMKEWTESEVPKNYWFSMEISQTFELIKYSEESKNAFLEMSRQIGGNQRDRAIQRVFERERILEKSLNERVRKNSNEKSPLERSNDKQKTVNQRSPIMKKQKESALHQSYLPQISKQLRQSTDIKNLHDRKQKIKSNKSLGMSSLSSKDQKIIDNAINKLNMLEKREMDIIAKGSLQQASSLLVLERSNQEKIGKAKRFVANQKKKEERDRPELYQRFQKSSQKLEKINEHSEENEKLKRSQKPLVPKKKFKQDLALNLPDQSESQNTTEYIPSFKRMNEFEQLIEQQVWSSEEKPVNTPISPISEAIITGRESLSPADTQERQQNEISKKKNNRQSLRQDTKKNKKPDSLHVGNVKIGEFPSTVLTYENKQEVSIENKKQELQLIFDEMVGCYYHPESNTYYEIND